MVDKVLHSSESVEWGTPSEVFDPLNYKYDFTFDPAASHEIHLTSRYATKDGAYDDPLTKVYDLDGLNISWQGERIFLNPPYGRDIKLWMRKAAQEAPEALIVALLPVRTGSKWWKEWVEPYADIEFLPGRLKFKGAKWAAPFDSAIARYR